MSSIGIDTATSAKGSGMTDTAQPSRSDAIVRFGVAALAVYHLVLAALMVFAPGTFFEDIGPFGVRNDHYLRDTATFNMAFAVALAVAYRRPSWRAPVLCCVAVQFVLHSLNHLADIGDAHPYWLGPADFISLASGAAILVWLARKSLRETELSS
ncbi:MAG TPA: hypothetical protein VIG42_01950 [Solirubrobacteraceae bacterium]|jgi:hypothetical protein